MEFYRTSNEDNVSVVSESSYESDFEDSISSHYDDDYLSDDECDEETITTNTPIEEIIMTNTPTEETITTNTPTEEVETSICESYSIESNSIDDSETSSIMEEVDTIQEYCEVIIENWDRKMNIHSYLNTYTYECRKKMIQDMCSCDCCPRHMYNRPTLTDFMKGTMERVDLPNSNNPHSQKTYKYMCECKCRHLARDICRTNNQVSKKTTICSNNDAIPIRIVG